MTKGQLYERGDQIAIAVPSGTLSGDPVVLGRLPGVALTDRDSEGESTVKFDGVHMLSVRGWDGTANAAIAAGATVFFTSGDTPKLNVRVAGIPYGTAMQAVTSGATATIPVRVGPANLA